ncbi:uncharacterized protein LTR77_001789 [Saxophila tyrrhenica]|uniref:Uncharacterized protein n=1 Tax=Saxophila tyrrhenica TaxID=1690608 RepID=A0AAV9PN35_9PEZI|nr:hypothetical protein LTR77_001789 [Saxophila tyrrhenica]
MAATGEGITTTASGSDPYSGGGSHGSAMTSGPGHGNKTAPDPEDVDTSGTRMEIAHDTRTYSGGTDLGSGTTAGPGVGNKAPPEHGGSSDSRTGKLMEKVGGKMGMKGMVETGTAKREAEGAFEGS